LHRPLERPDRTAARFIGSSIEDGHERREPQSFAGCADFRKAFPTPEDLPKSLGISAYLAEQKGLRKDDSPRENGKNEQGSQDESRDRGRILEDLDHIELIQNRLLD